VETRTLAAVLLAITGLCACTPGTNAIFQTAQSAFRSDAGTVTAPLNPDFRYLRATVDGRVVLLVLGYVENHAGGPIQVWYSAEREVLRLQNGRIAGAVGSTTEWRNVKLEGPVAWSSIKNTPLISGWTRIRDVMPGYHSGVRDVLSLRAISPPARSALQDLAPESLAWYEERIENHLIDSKNAEVDQLPPARYAVAFVAGAETVVYSEQCLARKLCFTLQLWPATPPSTKNSK
jgi:hypothetical protein